MDPDQTEERPSYWDRFPVREMSGGKAIALSVGGFLFFLGMSCVLLDAWDTGVIYYKGGITNYVESPTAYIFLFSLFVVCDLVILASFIVFLILLHKERIKTYW